MKGIYLEKKKTKSVILPGETLTLQMELPGAQVSSALPPSPQGHRGHRENIYDISGACVHSRCEKATILVFTLKKHRTGLFSQGDIPASPYCHMLWMCPFETEWESRKEVRVTAPLHLPLHSTLPGRAWVWVGKVALVRGFWGLSLQAAHGHIREGLHPRGAGHCAGHSSFRRAAMKKVS